MRQNNQVNKTKARRLYNNGYTIYLLPSNVIFNNIWVQPIRINKEEIESIKNFTTDFDKIINEYEFYNCNNQLGYYTIFFTDK